jgi:hypothetical protein
MMRKYVAINYNIRNIFNYIFLLILVYTRNMDVFLVIIRNVKSKKRYVNLKCVKSIFEGGILK